MRGINILEGIADLIVKGVMLLIYVPKTLYKIIKDPRWVPNYIADQTADEEPYKDYVAPVFLYIFSGLAPYALVSKEILLRELADNNDGTISGMLLDSATLTRAAIFICVPMIVAFFTELVKSTNLSRTSLEQNFFVQCYYMVPFVLMLQLRWVFHQFEDSLGQYGLYLVYALLILTVFWLLFTEINFLSGKLQGNWKKIIAVLLLSTILILVVTDSIGLKLVKAFEFSDKDLTEIFPLLILLATTIIYGVAWGKKYIDWNNKRKKN